MIAFRGFNMLNTLPLPELNTTWMHRTHKTYYEVYDITNVHSTKDKYPVMVSYRRLSDQTTWSRPLSLWYQDYTQVQQGVL